MNLNCVFVLCSKSEAKNEIFLEFAGICLLNTCFSIFVEIVEEKNNEVSGRKKNEKKLKLCLWHTFII